MIPPLEKKKPFLHFVRIPKDSPDRAEYEKEFMRNYREGS